jgi:hypothetical protein
VKLIQPSEISARILTLFDESDEWIILVSPYVKISKWYKLINKVNILISRSINLEIYVRDDPDNTATYRDLEQLDLDYKKIPHLHSKLYMNEKYGIVSSMNLLLSSEINSLEIGYVTESWAEYNDLLHYFYRFIHINEPTCGETIAYQPAADLNGILQNIRTELKKNAKNPWFWLSENVLHISTGKNTYFAWVKDGYLRISVYIKADLKLINKSKRHSSKIALKVENLTSMKTQVNPSSGPGILQLCSQAENKLESTCMNGIIQSEAAYIVESIKSFINATDYLVLFNQKSN